MSAPALVGPSREPCPDCVDGAVSAPTPTGYGPHAGCDVTQGDCPTCGGSATVAVPDWWGCDGVIYAREDTELVDGERVTLDGVPVEPLLECSCGRRIPAGAPHPLCARCDRSARAHGLLEAERVRQEQDRLWDRRLA